MMSMMVIVGVLNDSLPKTAFIPTLGEFPESKNSINPGSQGWFVLADIGLVTVAVVLVIVLEKARLSAARRFEIGTGDSRLFAETFFFSHSQLHQCIVRFTREKKDRSPLNL